MVAPAPAQSRKLGPHLPAAPLCRRSCHYSLPTLFLPVPPAPRNANISPFERFFSLLVYPERRLRRATQHSPLPIAQHLASRAFINLQIPLFPPSICNPPVISRLQTPLLATPLFSHRYKPPGVWGYFCLAVHESQVTSHKSRPFIWLPPLCPLSALFSTLVPFVFNSLQPLLQNTRVGGIQRFNCPDQRQEGTQACPLHNSSQLRVSYAPAPFEKLPTASASVLYTSKTVSSFVICRTS